MLYELKPGTEVTLARNVAQGALGAVMGTRCRVLEVAMPQPGAKDQTVVLHVQTMHGGVPMPLAMRVPAEETFEGLVNILEGNGALLGADVMATLQAIDSIQETHPEAAKAMMDFLMVKLSPQSREFATKRPDKTPPAPAPAAPAAAPSPEKP